MQPRRKRSERAIIKKVIGSKSVRGKRWPVFTEKAGLFKIAGIGKSREPGGFSWRKHELGI